MKYRRKKREKKNPESSKFLRLRDTQISKGQKEKSIDAGI